MRDLHSSKPNPGKVSRQTKTFKGEYKKQLEERDQLRKKNGS